MNLYLDDDNDIVIEGGNLRMTTPDEDLVQRVKAFLELNMGEWFLNTARGVPYTAEFVEPTVDAQKAILYVRGLLLQLDGVESVDNIDLQLDGLRRKVYGVITINKILTVEV